MADIRKKCVLKPVLFHAILNCIGGVEVLDKDDLQAIAGLITESLKPIHNRLDSMDSRLDSVDGRLDSMESKLNQLQDDVEILKEDTKVTRGAVNQLLDWADDASIQVVPLFNKKVK